MAIRLRIWLLATSLALGALALALALRGEAGVVEKAGGLDLKRIGAFDSPVYVDDPPGRPNLLLVVEQHGRIRMVKNGEQLKRSFLDLSDRVRYGGEQGLLSIAFDPGYARNRRFYVYYVNNQGNIEVDALRRKRKTATSADPNSRRKVIEIRHPRFNNHNGGQLQFGPDGRLYLGTGDGGGFGDPDENAQDRRSLLGKLLRITPKRAGGYSTPKSNPFVGRKGRDEIYALGLRNPWRFSFDRRSRRTFIGDAGQNSWEEIDRVGLRRLRGANFGWDIFEGDHHFEGGDTPADYVPPAFEYASTGSNCAVIGGYVVRDRTLPSLQGRYVYTDLCRGQIRSFKPSKPRSSDSPTGLSVGSPSSFGEGVADRVYVASLEGRVFRIVRR